MNIKKLCGVPLCENTSIKTPNKLFVYVPKNKTIRVKWLKLARRDPSTIKICSSLYFCEDHFDLPNDMENYMEYHVMGSVAQVRMKPGCVPRKFECQPDRRKQPSDTIQRTYINKKRKIMAIKEYKKDLGERSPVTNQLEPRETSFGRSTTVECNVSVKEENVHSEIEIKIEQSDNEDVTCLVCGLSFRRLYELLEHKKLHFIDSTNIDIKCNMVIDNQMPVEAESKSLNDSTEYIYRCVKCQESFNNNCGLVKHIKCTHRNKRQYQCDVCEKQFILRCSLYKHMVIHSDKRPYVCSICEKTFKLRQYLNDHMKLHTKNGLYQCYVCEKQFIHKCELNRHMIAHSDERPYACNQCEKIFKRRPALKDHMKLHAEHRLYPCDVCEKQFIKKFYLNRHMRTHSDERPFACTKCEKRFKLREGFKAHMKLHTKNELY